MVSATAELIECWWLSLVLQYVIKRKPSSLTKLCYGITCDYVL